MAPPSLVKQAQYHMCIDASEDAGERILPVVPFDPRNLLLPGEEMKFQLDEPQCEAMMCAYLADPSKRQKLFGQLLVTASPSGPTISAVLPTLEIVERCTRGSTTWLRAKCVGRTALVQPQALTSTLGMVPVKPFVDTADIRPATEDATSSTRAQVDTLFGRCLRMENELHAQIERRLDPQRCAKRAASAPRFEPLLWSRGSITCSSGCDASWPLLAQHRAAVLLERGMDVPPAATHADTLHELWGVTSDGELEDQLESFTAYAYLGYRDRMRALRCESTERRLECAVAALQRQTRHLHAAISLNQV